MKKLIVVAVLFFPIACIAQPFVYEDGTEFFLQLENGKKVRFNSDPDATMVLGPDGCHHYGKVRVIKIIEINKKKKPHRTEYKDCDLKKSNAYWKKYK